MFRRTGSSIVEAAAGLCILIPLLIMIVYVVLEVGHAYLIWAALQQGAQQAARLLATTYASHPSVVNNVSDQCKYGFDLIRTGQIINDSAQFSPALFLPSTSAPKSVTVTVTYTSGKYGLPPFPDADVLHLGSKFILQGSARYTLE